MPRPRLILLVVAALLVVAVPSAVADNGNGPLGLSASLQQDGTTVQLQWTTAVAGQTLVRDPGGVSVRVGDGDRSASDSVTNDGTDYTWTLTQDDGSGNGPQTDTAMVNTTGSVSGLGATDVGPDHVTLSWNPPNDPDAAQILVSRHTDTCTGAVLKKTLGANATTWTDTSVAGNTTYCYRVVVQSTAGDLAPADEVNATTSGQPIDSTPPGPVSNLAANASVVGSIGLSWNNPGANDLAGIEVRKKVGRNCPTSSTDGVRVGGLLEGSPVPDSTTDSSVVEGQTYCYGVWAFDDAGNYSSEQTIAVTAANPPDTTAPGPVSGLTANTSVAGSIGLSWNNPGANDLAGIEVRKKVGSSCPTRSTDGVRVGGLLEGSPVPNSTSDFPVVRGQTYCYGVWAFDDAGNYSSEQTIQATATNPPDTTAPGPVSRLAAIIRAGHVRLSWHNPSAADLDRIFVRRGRLACPRTATDGSPVGSVAVRTSQLDRGARAGRDICYAVFAVDSAGNAARAATVHATIPPNVKRLVVAAGCTRGSITWRTPSSPQLLRVLIVRNARHAPRNAGDGRVRHHRRGRLLDRSLHKRTTYSYRLYTIYRSGNRRQPVVYSSGKVVHLHTGNVCTPMNGGSAGRRPMLHWLRRRGAHRYAVRIVRARHTLLLRYPFHTSFHVRATWAYGGRRHQLLPGHVYQVFVYAYTTARPQGVLVGQSSFRVRG